jgi:hypothetical protein
MPKQATAKEFLPADDALADDDADVCENCGNVYRVVWLRESDNYNDFGQRYCPFCGLLTNEW